VYWNTYLSCYWKTFKSQNEDFRRRNHFRLICGYVLYSVFHYAIQSKHNIVTKLGFNLISWNILNPSANYIKYIVHLLLQRGTSAHTVFITYWFLVILKKKNKTGSGGAFVQTLLHWKSSNHYIFWVCVSNGRHAPHCHLWLVGLHIFSLCLNKRHDLKKKNCIEHKMCLDFL